MRFNSILFVTLLLVFASVSCGNAEEYSSQTVKTYSLCAKPDSKRTFLLETMEDFAEGNNAEFSDRSQTGYEELVSIEADVLSRTNQPYLQAAIYKENEYRISATNLGLYDKVALNIRFLSEHRAEEIDKFIELIELDWHITGESRAVQAEPRCSQ